MKIKVEAWKTSKMIMQCKKCQIYGYKQFYNTIPERIKCASTVKTVVCTKPRDTLAKCSNCMKMHQANY